MSRRRAVITGIGPITCIGRGRENFWNGILSEKSGISTISGFDASAFHVRCAGEIRDWDSEEFFAPHRLKRLDRYAQFAVASAKLALDDAGLHYSRESPQHRVGVSFGTALGGVCKAEDQYIRYLKKGARGVQPTLAVQVFGGSAHSNIAIDFGFRGVGTTNSNSCASGTVSVGEALRYIRDDFADVIVAGGAEAPLTTITIGAFDIIKTMSRWPGDPALAWRRRCLAHYRRDRTRAKARRAYLRGSARLQSQQRCFPYDFAPAGRRFMHPRDARRTGGRTTGARANRLYQCTRQLDAVE